MNLGELIVDMEGFIESVRNRKDKSKAAIINGDVGDDNYIYGAYAYSIGHGDLFRPEVFIVEQYEDPIAINENPIKGLTTVIGVGEDDLTTVGKGIRETMIRVLDNWDTIPLVHGSTYVDNNNTYEVKFLMAIDYKPEKAVKLFPLLLMYHDCNNFPLVLLNAKLVKH